MESVKARRGFADGAIGLPLLAATLTRDPLQVSLVNLAEWLPWQLFGLLSGALVDRLDRRGGVM